MRSANTEPDELRYLSAQFPIADLVTSAEITPPYYDEPKLWVLTSRLRINHHPQQLRLKRGIEAEYGYSGSAGVSLNCALRALFGESAERYALLPRKAPNNLVSFRDLGEQRAMDPQRVAAGVKHSTPDRSQLPMRWIEGKDISEDTTVLVPRQLIEVPYIYARGEAILRSPITTGAAAGQSLPDCQQRGLLEIIERDTFMLGWMTQVRLKRIGTPRRFHPDSKALQSIYKQCGSYGLSAELRLVPCSFPVSVVAAFLFDGSGCGPKVTVGASAAFDQEQASLKALLEALQLRCWLRSEKNKLVSSGTTVHALDRPIRTIRQRAALLFREDYAFKIQQWANNVDESPSCITPPMSCSELVGTLQRQDCSGAVVDLSDRLPRKVRDAGIHVAKVVVPEMQPLWLNDFAQDISWRRLISYSKSHGVNLCERQKQIPHPFL